MAEVFGAKFWKFLQRIGATSADAARALHVSRATLTSWKKKGPDGLRRRAITIWTNGEVQDADWDSQHERAYLRSISPFPQPASKKQRKPQANA